MYSLLILVCLLGAVCSSRNSGTPKNSGQDPAGRIVYTDGLDRQVRIPKRPQRIISLAPDVTETLYLLGAQDRLIGVTTQCDWPEAVKQKPKIGDLLNPNYEVILANKPDLVIASTAGNDQAAVMKLSGRGLPVYVSAPRSVERIFQSIEALGLFLIQHLPAPWMSGAIMGSVFMACCLALLPLPDVKAYVEDQRPLKAIRTVSTSLWRMVKTRDGYLTALLCMLPVATGAAQGTLTQAAVAAHWGAGAEHVELAQGLLSGLITATGCFMGGWVCHRFNPRSSYAFFGIVFAGIAVSFAYAPTTINSYIVWNMIYALALGLSYAAFTAMALVALRGSAAATGYNVFASLSNFPLWWLGLLLGWVADHHGARSMLLTEAVLGVLGVVLFGVVDRLRRANTFAVQPVEV